MRARKASTAFVMMGTLALAGIVLGRVADPVWTALRARQPALRIDSTGRAVGEGTTLAMLGGFRALVADAAWLRMYALWEQRDLAGTDALAHLVSAIDPRPLYFWLNSSRVIAYDLAAWRILAAGGYDVVPATVQRRIGEEQARAALRQLDAAQAFHPASADLWIERANIEFNKLGDLNAAAESYRRAGEQPDAPYYAARLEAEMLRRAGRLDDALACLVRLHPTLPPDDEAAGAEVVLGRIRALEQQLHVPPARAYHPPAGR